MEIGIKRESQALRADGAPGGLGGGKEVRGPLCLLTPTTPRYHCRTTTVRSELQRQSDGGLG